jgi:hypothetical protein
LLVLVVLAVAAMVYPRYAEHTDDACAAFAKRLQAMLPAGNIQVNYAQLADNDLQTQYPQVPAPIRCAVAWWATKLDPGMVETLRRSLPAQK